MKTKFAILSIRLAVVGLIVPFMVSKATADEYWVALRSDSLPGMGTQANPYNGSTATRFDNVMRSIPANATIHLGEGTFATRGYQDYTPVPKGFVVKPGWQVIGSGRDTTTVKLISLMDVPSGEPYNGTVFCTGIGGNDGSGSLVADVTVDCNAAALASQSKDGTSYKVSAIGLGGNNCTIRNVHAIHAYGNYASLLECFTLDIGNFYDANGVWQPTVNALIEDCLVDNSDLDYGIGITIGDGSGEAVDVSGIIRQNEVDDWGGTCAIGAGAGKDILVEDNVGNNNRVFVRADTGTLQHSVYRGNTIYGSSDGDFVLTPSLGAANFHDIIVENNTSTITGDGSFFGISGVNGTAANYTVRNNHVTAIVPPGSAYEPIYLDHVENVSVYGNEFAGPKNTHASPGATDVNFVDEAINPSFQGAIKLTGTFSTGGYLFYSLPPGNSVVISTGDRLRYKNFEPDGNPSFEPEGWLHFTDNATTQEARDQWGYSGAEVYGHSEFNRDISLHARGKWYQREFDLTAYTGKTVGEFCFGEGSHVAGSISHYWRDVVIVDQSGQVKATFSGTPSYLYSGSVASGYSGTAINPAESFAKADADNVLGTQSFANNARETFDILAVQEDPDGLVDDSTDRITAPDNGTMMIKWSCQLASAVESGDFYIEVSKNGSPIARTYLANAESRTYTVVATDACDADDYYTCTLYNSTGSAVLIGQDPSETFVEARFYNGVTF